MVAAKHSMPYVGINHDQGDAKVLDEGIFVDFFLELQKELNFTFTAYPTPDDQWGTLRSDGTWTGVVGELQMKRADIGLSNLMVTQVLAQ